VSHPTQNLPPAEEKSEIARSPQNDTRVYLKNSDILFGGEEDPAEHKFTNLNAPQSSSSSQQRWDDEHELPIVQRHAVKSTRRRPLTERAANIR